MFRYILLRSVMVCYVLSVLSRPIKFSHFRRDCHGRFLNCQKICHGVHGYPGLLRLPIPFPCVASRLSRFAHGCTKRGCRDRREHSVNAVLGIHVPCSRIHPWHSRGVGAQDLTVSDARPQTPQFKRLKV